MDVYINKSFQLLLSYSICVYGHQIVLDNGDI